MKPKYKTFPVQREKILYKFTFWDGLVEFDMMTRRQRLAAGRRHDVKTITGLGKPEDFLKAEYLKVAREIQ